MKLKEAASQQCPIENTNTSIHESTTHGHDQGFGIVTVGGFAGCLSG